jgi:hypothetical protein
MKNASDIEKANEIYGIVKKPALQNDEESTVFRQKQAIGSGYF